MKKLVISLALVAGVLVGCNNTSTSNSDEFVGTWKNISTTQYCAKYSEFELIIAKNNGGQKYSVKDVRNNKTLDDFTAELDGKTLIVDTGTVGKINLTIQNSQIDWRNINRSSFSSENCTMQKQ